MRFTLRNLQKEEEVDKKFHNYRKLAIQAEERAIKREVEYNDFSEAIDQKIQKNHDAYILHARRLKKYTEKIMSEDPHEYANKLISMDKYLQQKDKAYNI